ncbi:MarR family winged helix-turn-helix transcriptional regulator [Gephyromycinifex aptenodytis]|uniref:MarR family winged helix-turn-helix transcriptional regulator n=1 Tax=Gephyromycinifex aptenodytis TaxID=2716227 RepID=UPI001445D123|nr:MarR family winged helix-turn-helix transcriptional regulator [Gephyromycinifex aptenodytis]
MTSDEELDFWSFVRLARTRLTQQGFSDPHATELLLTLNRASGIITYDLEASVHRPAGRSWATFRILYVLWLAGDLEPRRVAELTGLTRAAVSNHLGPLLREGLLHREPAAHDGRSVILSLSTRGEREIQSLFAAQHEREVAWTAALTQDEQATLVRLLDKLVSRTDLDVRHRH